MKELDQLRLLYDVGDPVHALGQADYVGIWKIFVRISLLLWKHLKNERYYSKCVIQYYTRAFSQHV